MSDLFSLAPEGQAWADEQAASKQAQPDDYDPRWYAGSGSALFRGAAEGTIGLGQTLVETAKLLPTYSALRGDLPELDNIVDQNFTAMQKSLNDARNAVKPAPNSQGMAAEILEGLGTFAPAIAASALAGPVAGGAVAFGSSYEPTRQDFLAKGVNEDTAGTLALEQAGANALGMALPAGVGGRLATRLLSGIGINTGFGAANRFALGETLEENGYAELAKQYRVWDKQALLVDGVLGAAFGGVHHLTAQRADTPLADPAPVPPESAATTTAEVQPSVGTESAISADAPVLGDVPAAGEPMPTYESRVAELQDLAGQIVNRGDRKALSQEVHDLQYQHDQATTQLQELKNTPLSGSGKALSQARAQRTAQVNELDMRIGLLKEQLDQRGATLADSSPGGRFYEARSDLSRIEQGLIPESMRGLVPEAQIKPSDVDAAHVMNEGLYYDLESSPVVHSGNESLNSHVAAMDQASRQLLSGEPVNVSAQIRGLDGIARPDAIATGEAQRATISEAYRENGIAESVPQAAEPTIPPVREGSAFAGGRTAEPSAPEQISTDPVTGESISSNSYDLMAARDMSQANADIMISHPDTGEPVSLAQALADLDNQIATVQKESKVYSVAATCFLRNP
ncbi:hypothetical protein ABEH29_07645 [Pantoea agglomerans]|uniref:hypothetical protein n=1 Tax=Enterobacter agglomerans TaxID=549 RepID=UPI0016540688|nr:hypothetical protein [Pantoea agglomerans]MCX2192095.1 hypothetical protein [Pantoea agglomerans]